MKNVLFIAYEFPPRGESGVQRSAKFVKYLPQFGYHPVVLTGAEEHIRTARDESLLEDVKSATIYPCRGWQWLLTDLPNKLKLRRLARLFLQPDRNILGWVPSAKRMARKIAREHEISAIYTSVCPFSSAMLGMKLRKLLGVPWVIDYRDPWTDDAIRMWASKYHYRFQLGQERRALAHADAAVVVTPTMKELLATRYPRWADKIHMIPNGYDAEDFPERHAEPTDSRLRIVHTGKMRDYDQKLVNGRMGPLARFWLNSVAFQLADADLSSSSPYYLFQAVRMLLDERPELEDRISLVFAGNFGTSNRRLVGQFGLEKIVDDKGYIPHNQSVDLLRTADVLFFPLMATGNQVRNYIYSGKLFEYLAAEKPILAVAPDSDATDLIKEAKAGWCIDPHDIKGIKSLIEELIERKAAGNLSVTPDPLVTARFERRTLTQQLAGLFDSLLEGAK